MLLNTSTSLNPWHVIPADNKEKMRKLVAEIMIKELKSLNPQYPSLEPFKESELQLVNKLLNKG